MTEEIKRALWHEIEAAWPQLSDAMMSRLTEVLWPNDLVSPATGYKTEKNVTLDLEPLPYWGA